MMPSLEKGETKELVERGLNPSDYTDRASVQLGPQNSPENVANFLSLSPLFPSIDSYPFSVFRLCEGEFVWEANEMFKMFILFCPILMMTEKSWLFRMFIGARKVRCVDTRAGTLMQRTIRTCKRKMPSLFSPTFLLAKHAGLRPDANTLLASSQTFSDLPVRQADTSFSNTFYVSFLPWFSLSYVRVLLSSSLLFLLSVCSKIVLIRELWISRIITYFWDGVCLITWKQKIPKTGAHFS